MQAKSYAVAIIFHSRHHLITVFTNRSAAPSSDVDVQMWINQQAAGLITIASVN